MNDFTPRALVYVAQTFLTNTCILYIDNRHYGYFTWVTANTYLKWVVSICLKYVLTYLTQCLIYMKHSISRGVLLTLGRWFTLAADLWLYTISVLCPRSTPVEQNTCILGCFFEAIFVILPKPGILCMYLSPSSAYYTWAIFCLNDIVILSEFYNQNDFAIPFG